MINTRHIGYFILHTIKPMIEELDEVLKKCEKINLRREDLELMVNHIIELEIEKSFIYCTTYVLISMILGYVTWLILH